MYPQSSSVATKKFELGKHKEQEKQNQENKKLQNKGGKTLDDTNEIKRKTLIEYKRTRTSCSSIFSKNEKIKTQQNSLMGNTLKQNRSLWRS